MKSPGLNEQQLQKMKTHPGFIAALDQSGGRSSNCLRDCSSSAAMRRN